MRHRRLLLPVVVVPYLLLSVASIGSGSGRAGDCGPPPDETSDFPLAYKDDFERDELKGWEFTDKSAWRITHLDDQHKRVLDQFRESKYQPPVRSPLNIALVQGIDLAD